MRRSVSAAAVAAGGAVLGLLLAAVLRIGASTSCLDVIDIDAPAGACAVPTAAAWALVAGAIAGALLGLAAVVAAGRRRGR